jgi:Arm DNA-binding domain/Phage integrase family
VVRETGSKNWVFMFRRGGRGAPRREMRLGSFSDVTLAEAREEATRAPAHLANKRDPIEERAKEQKPGAMTFGEAAKAYIESMSPDWEPRHYYAWSHTLLALKPDGRPTKGQHDYCKTLRGLPVKEVDTNDVVGTTILTASRMKEALAARWSEIDFDTRTWTKPKERMKGRRGKRKEHRVPLSTRAVVILHALHEMRINEFIFPGVRRAAGQREVGINHHLSAGRLVALLEDLKVDDMATTHGFRSSFRDWAGNRQVKDQAGNLIFRYPHEMLEFALAHKLPDPTVGAHRRSDMLEERRPLMEDWADHCEPREGNVVVLPQRTAR